MRRQLYVYITIFIFLFGLFGLNITNICAAGKSFDEYLIDNFEAGIQTINVSEYNMSVEEINQKINYLFKTNPELFYVDDAYEYVYRHERVKSLEFNYYGSKAEISDMKKQFNESVYNAKLEIDKISPSSESYTDKVKIVYEYLTSICEYDYACCKEGEITHNSYTAYGALVEKKAVCLGISMAYQYLLSYIYGIECEIITNDGMNHAWNVVKIMDNYYHVDLTHECMQLNKNADNDMDYSFFMKSDAAMNHMGYDSWNESYSADDKTYDNYLW